jgi:hypothetical protein
MENLSKSARKTLLRRMWKWEKLGFPIVDFCQHWSIGQPRQLVQTP